MSNQHNNVKMETFSLLLQKRTLEKTKELFLSVFTNSNENDFVITTEKGFMLMKIENGAFSPADIFNCSKLNKYNAEETIKGINGLETRNYKDLLKSDVMEIQNGLNEVEKRLKILMN